MQKGQVNCILNRNLRNWPLLKWMLPLAIFQDWLGSIFTKKRVLTRQIAKGILRGDANYDSSPATEVLGIDWIDVDTTIKDTVEAYQ